MDKFEPLVVSTIAYGDEGDIDIIQNYVYTFDENGHLIQRDMTGKTWYSWEGEYADLWSTLNYYYDDKGNLDRTEFVASNNFNYVSFYDENGNIYLSSSYDLEQNGELYSTKTYEHEIVDGVVRKTILTDDTLTYTVETTYDEHGNEVESNYSLLLMTRPVCYDIPLPGRTWHAQRPKGPKGAQKKLSRRKVLS